MTFAAAIGELNNRIARLEKRTANRREFWGDRYPSILKWQGNWEQDEHDLVFYRKIRSHMIPLSSDEHGQP